MTQGMTFAGLLCLALFALTGLIRQFHMLQLNSYYQNRYLSWLRGNLRGALMARSIALVIFVAAELFFYFSALFWRIPFALFALVSLVVRFWFCLRQQRMAKKRLVVTARVKRLFLTSALVFVALAVLGVCFPLHGLFPLILCLFILLPPLGALLANGINLPVERAVARWYRNDAVRLLQSMPGLRVIGVTGSYGKTSTKYILGRMLSEKYNVLITPESFNTPMGIVRTVREKMRPGTEIFIAEMGAKQVGDIREICEICHPEMGVITSVGPQHLETFHTIENVAKTKFELFDAVAAVQGPVFINGDSDLCRKQAAGRPAITFGIGADCDCQAQQISYSRTGARFTLCWKERRIPVTTRLLGPHNVLNIAAAAAVALELGLSDAEIQVAVSQLKPITHRLELRSFFNGSVLIDDAFNANPAGCLAAVEVLSHFEGMKKIIVTPGLVELGEKEYMYNRQLGEAAAAVCDEIYLVGEERAKPLLEGARNAGYPEKQLQVFATFQQALEHLKHTVDQSCAVLFENDLPDNYAK